MSEWTAPEREESGFDPIADLGNEDPEDVDPEENREEAEEETSPESAA